MNAISKPHLVDLLRIFDKKRLLTPRIRYASVRSKPELIRDLDLHFFTYVRGDVLHLQKRKHHLDIPEITYDLAAKCYLFDGQHVDVPRESREKIRFEISRVPVTIHFPCYSPPQEGLPAKRTETGASRESPIPSTGSLSDCSSQSVPSTGSDSTPRLVSAYPPSSDS